MNASSSLTIPYHRQGPAHRRRMVACGTRDLLQRTAEIKSRPSKFASVLRGKHIALIFEKPSLRTRVTFEVGIQSMGGYRGLPGPHASAARRTRIHSGRRAKPGALGAGIVARVYEQRVLEEMAASIRFRWSTRSPTSITRARRSPISSLSKRSLAPCEDSSLPTSATATMSAIRALSRRAPRRASPDRHAGELRSRTGRGCGCQARRQGDTRAASNCSPIPPEGVAGAQAVYTDSWASMGFEAEEKIRRHVFKSYQVNRKLMRKPRPAPFSCIACRRIAARK